MVPAANIVGTLGGATLCMHRNLEIERLVLAAMSLGIARRSIEVMAKYAEERKAFGKSIGEYGQIQKMISESYADYMAGRSYVYNVANHLDLSRCVCVCVCVCVSVYVLNYVPCVPLGLELTYPSTLLSYTNRNLPILYLL